MTVLTAVGLLILTTLALRLRTTAANRAGRHAADGAAVLFTGIALYVLVDPYGPAAALGLVAALFALTGVATALLCQQLESTPKFLAALACVAVGVGVFT